MQKTAPSPSPSSSHLRREGAERRPPPHPTSAERGQKEGRVLAPAHGPISITLEMTIKIITEEMTIKIITMEMTIKIITEEMTIKIITMMTPTAWATGSL